MTEPTDAEIFDAADDFRSQYKHGGTTFDEFDALGFARAVLQRWGQPAASGEPVAWMHPANSSCVTTDPTAYARGIPLYKGPQPVAEVDWIGASSHHLMQKPSEAQAGAVPLTRERVKAILTECGYDGASPQHRGDFINGLRHGEAAHGIKGGQHGAE